MQPKVIAIFGPTGVGKTEVAVGLARRLKARGEQPTAVSADSMQLYAGLEILTGAPSARQIAELEHKLVGTLALSETSDLARFAQAAHAEIDAIMTSGGRPIVLGGTGLYLRAALADLDLLPPPASGMRDRFERQLTEGGPQALHETLAAVSPETAALLDPAEPRRIIRALEALEQGVDPTDRTTNQLWTENTRLPTVLVGLTVDREDLYRKIDGRVDAMFAAGVHDEVTLAVARGAGKTARQAIGFDRVLSGDVEGMKQDTRRYAKRQLTWMRKLAGVVVVDMTGREHESVIDEVLAIVDRDQPDR